MPRSDEQYFGWIDLAGGLSSRLRLCSRLSSSSPATDAGIARAAALARDRRLAAQLVGVEAHSTHFEWMTDHLTRRTVRTRSRRFAVDSIVTMSSRGSRRTAPNAVFDDPHPHASGSE